jgi:hypothetical protein
MLGAAVRADQAAPQAQDDVALAALIELPWPAAQAHR